MEKEQLGEVSGEGVTRRPKTKKVTSLERAWKKSNGTILQEYGARTERVNCGSEIQDPSCAGCQPCSHRWYL